MQPMVIEPAPSTCKVDSYRSKYSYILGGSHIALGVISIILNVVGLQLVPTVIIYLGIRSSFDVQHGIWSGIFFVITGSFGLGAGCYRNKCLVRCFMILSIISASLFVPVIGAVDILYLEKMKRAVNVPGIEPYFLFKGQVQKAVGLHAGLLTCALLELTVAVVSAVFCCRAVCCGTSSTSLPGQTVFMQTPAGAQQAILIPQGSTQPGIQQGVFQLTPAQQYVVQAPGGMAVAPPPYLPLLQQPEMAGDEERKVAIL